MLRVQQEDDKELYLSDAQSAEEEATRLLQERQYGDAMKALERAKTAYKRAGGGAGSHSLEQLEKDIAEGQKAVEAEEREKKEREQELKKMSEEEQSAAEEQVLQT